MEKAKVGKFAGRMGQIIALIAVAVIVVGGISVGIMAAMGVFASDKEKAFRLLSQAPEKIFHSSVADELEIGQLLENMGKNGSDMTISLNPVSVTTPDGTMDSIDEMGIGKLSDYTAGISVKTDTEGKSLMNVSLEKAGTPLSMNYYMDTERISYSLPELLSGKVLSADYKNLEGANSPLKNYDAEKIKEYEEAFAGFFADEFVMIKDEIECEKCEGGYTLTIPRESMDAALNDFQEFLESDEQKELVQDVNDYVNGLTSMRYTYQTGDGEESFDLLSSVRMAVSTLIQYTQDFTFNVYGEDNEFEGLETTLKDSGITAVIKLDITGGEEDSTVNLTADLSSDDSGEKIVAKALLRNTKDDICETSLDFDIASAGTSLGSFTFRETFNSSDNTCNFKGALLEQGQESFSIEGKGAVKDLKPGSYLDYALDEISIKADGDTCTAAMNLDIKMGELEESIKPLEGEEISITKDTAETEMSKYTEEVATNLSKILEAWGINDFSSFLPDQDADTSSYYADESDDEGLDAYSYDSSTDGSL